MKIVTNSSPLIILAKLNALDLLSGHTLYVPLSVKDEVLAKECAEKDKILRLFRQKNIIISSLNKYTTGAILGKGEMDAIYLAKQKNISMVLMDDRRARSHAKLHGLTTKGTIWIILQAYRKRKITKQRAKKYIYHLPETGFYIGERLLMQILEIIDR